MEVPQRLAGRICLGIDEIQRHFLINDRTSPVVINTHIRKQENPPAEFRRRWIATMLSGIILQRAANAKFLTTETAILNRLGFQTGAALLDALTRTVPSRRRLLFGTFLAVAIYLRSCNYELGRSRGVLLS